MSAAAPGGKSFSAAFAMGDKGRIISCDVHGSKLKRIEEGAARLGLTSIETAASDGRVFRPEWADAYDTVLVDAPCSGLGIIRKKPDVRYKRADDLFTLPVVQTALLDNAARYVAPAVCWFTPPVRFCRRKTRTLRMPFYQSTRILKERPSACRSR